MSKKRIDLTGQRFGRLVVIGYNEEVSKQKKGSHWNCICDCGNNCTINGTRLKSGKTRSCGCLMREKSSENAKKLWANEDFREKHSKKQSELAKKQWEDEEFRKLKIEQGKKQYHPKGELHPNYNHEMTDEERREGRLQEGYDAWTKQVKADANYTCDCCGVHGGKLHSHHKDGYKWCKERRIDITNGVCLCEKCHREFHSKYGVKNNTEQQYIDFKKEKTKKM